MISKLKGIVDELKPTELILDVNGTGYQVLIPFPTYEKIKDDINISLHIFTYHKEDSLKLYGFYTKDEKNLFMILINISGIGPAMALSILSGISIPELLQAVKNDNPSMLIKIPGIGNTKAEKLIFELKRKIKKLEEFSIDIPSKPSIKNDAVEALTSLGFDESKSIKLIEAILSENADASIENVVKTALKKLSS